MMPTHTLNISNQWLSLEDVNLSISHTTTIEIDNDAIEKINKCRQYLDNKLIQSNELLYGINTGFGFLQNVQIDASQIESLQYNLLMSHACGIGEEVPEAIVKLMLLLKIKSLAFGYSGVQLSTVLALVNLYNHHILPIVFTQGSLGASGDLSPLAHLALPLIGLGQVYYHGNKISTQQLVQEHTLTTIILKSKEGLALINGTQFMSAYGMYCLHKAQRLLHLADLIAAISYDAFDCNLQPLHPATHKIRAHKGQITTAATIKKYLLDSSIANQQNKQTQDPYSFRCIPQVHGATKDVFENVLHVFLTEINSVTDNPNIFPDDDLILSGGNFHGQPLALQLDFLSIAMSEIANISERRIYQLISGQRGLPLFLISNPGLHSGFMIPQYTAAGIVSENKQLCTPASVDSISSSNNQEDHVSMGANAATKCLRVINNVEKVLAIELLTATQALEFRRPLQSSSTIENIVASFRQQISFNEADRILHNDILKTIAFIQNMPIQ